MARRAVFRFDASAAIGLGHAIRCLALADELGARGWDVLLCANPGAMALASQVRRVRWPVLEHADFSAPEALSVAAGACDLLVFDHYGIDARYETACRARAYAILVIDDLADRAHACDLLLDQTLGRGDDAYVRLAPGARLLLGPDYALLDARFARARPAALARRQAQAPAQSILLTLGGAPAWPALTRLAAICAAAAPALRIDVAAGASAQAGPLPATVRLHAPDADIAALMAGADIAIGAGGGASWERCALGLPAVLVEVAANQRAVMRALADAGAAIHGGVLDALEDVAVARMIADLAADNERRRDMALHAAALCDGLGARRAANSIETLFEPGPSISLRPARAEDGEIMLRWQQAPGARRFSNDPQTPDRAAHFAWLHKRLADPLAGPFEIIEVAGAPTGVLRFDRADGGYRVSVLVAEAFQGRGVARRALIAGGALLAEHSLLAQVQAANAASLQLFRSCGYVQIGADEFRRAPLRADGA